MRRIFALLLLAVLGLGLSAGAHPCAARTADPAPSAAHPPCHGLAQKAPAQPGTGGDGGSRDADHPCPHACHVMAVVIAMPMPFVAERVTEVSAPAPVRPLRPLARSIDHIPLA